LAALVLVAVGLALSVSGSNGQPKDPARTATSAVPAATPTSPADPPPASADWLGLNGNSSASDGSRRDFAARGIVYDREGNIEVEAGRTPETGAEFRAGLAESYRAKMIPDIQVDPAIGVLGCQTDPVPKGLCLPTSRADITAYVRGFIRTAASVVHDYPHHRVLFEPMDEPWSWASPPGTPPGTRAAREYATILTQLLPAARAARVQLRDIYVPATGTLRDGTRWIRDLYNARPCLAPGPSSCGPIAGWNLHPYGLPHSSTEGIDSVPIIRAQMPSGQDNLVISELGFCATDVNNSQGCADNQPDIVATSPQTASWLRETLTEAARMHRAGWLKALIIWERSGTGFAMQNDNGRLTSSGRILDLFAASPSGH
jgi:hypothetical protein